MTTSGGFTRAQRLRAAACCARTLALYATLLSLVACGGGDKSGQTASSADTTPPPPEWAPAIVSAEAFEALRWIEGRWIGSGGSEPFFESYTFVDDTTIRTRSWIDSTFSFAADSGLVVLSGGVVTLHGGDATWVATEIDSVRVHFEPRLNALNDFSWIRQSADTWRAELNTSTDGRILFEMRRPGGR